MIDRTDNFISVVKLYKVCIDITMIMECNDLRLDYMSIGVETKNRIPR